MQPAVQIMGHSTQRPPLVEVRSYEDDWGHLRTYEGMDAIAKFASVGLQVPLSEIYSRVAFEACACIFLLIPT